MTLRSLAHFLEMTLYAIITSAGGVQLFGHVAGASSSFANARGPGANLKSGIEIEFAV